LRRFDGFCDVDSCDDVNFKFLSHVDVESRTNVRNSSGILSSLKDEVIDEHCVELANGASHIKVLLIVVHCLYVILIVFNMNLTKSNQGDKEAFIDKIRLIQIMLLFRERFRISFVSFYFKLFHPVFIILI